MTNRSVQGRRVRTSFACWRRCCLLRPSRSTRRTWLRACRTAGDLAWLLSKETVETRKLSRAAIETLAIIAYHQPVTRAEIEDIRGVTTSKGSVDVLLQTGWIRPRGRRKGPGFSVNSGTTETFLSHFGL